MARRSPTVWRFAGISIYISFWNCGLTPREFRDERFIRQIGLRPHDGNIICVEVVQPETMKQATEEQQAFLDTFKLSGDYAGIASSTDAADRI